MYVDDVEEEVEEVEVVVVEEVEVVVVGQLLQKARHSVLTAFGMSPASTISLLHTVPGLSPDE